MAESLPYYKDAATARLLAAGSTIGAYVPTLRKLVNTIPVPNSVPTRWHAMRGPASNIDNWLSFQANSESGRVPRNYKGAAIINIARDELDAVHDRVGGVHAVAYKLGAAGVIGVMESRRFFADNPDDANLYQIAMGIGQGELHATAGVYNSDTKEFAVPASGLEAGLVLPVTHLAPHIPLM